VGVPPPAIQLLEQHHHWDSSRQACDRQKGVGRIAGTAQHTHLAGRHHRLWRSAGEEPPNSEVYNLLLTHLDRTLSQILPRLPAGGSTTLSPTQVSCHTSMPMILSGFCRSTLLHPWVPGRGLTLRNKTGESNQRRSSRTC
jgi:hypothetical protein